MHSFIVDAKIQEVDNESISEDSKTNRDSPDLNLVPPLEAIQE